MRKEKIINMRIIRNFLLICLLICLFINPVYASTRNIYIGDPITLEIKSQTLTEEELEKALEKFEIMELKRIDGGYQITIRSFDTGEKNITIEKNEIIIMIASMLEEVEKEDIYEVDFTQAEITGSRTIKKSFRLGLFVLFALAFVTSGVLLLIRKIKDKKEKDKPPFMRFHKSLDSLDLNKETALEDMTMLLKRYLEEVFNYKIMGKTSKEIMAQIQWDEGKVAYKQDVEEWLMKCDYYKFGGIQVGLKEKEQLKEELSKLTAFIHEREEVTPCN